MVQPKATSFVQEGRGVAVAVLSKALLLWEASGQISKNEEIHNQAALPTFEPTTIRPFFAAVLDSFWSHQLAPI